MGKVDLGIKIAERIGLFGKASKSFVRKPIPITKDTIFAYKPNYDRAVNSWNRMLLGDGYNSQTAQKLTKLKVKEDMITWGRPLENTNLIRRSNDPKLLDIKSLGEDASTYVMNITNKARAINRAKYNPIVAERMKTHPELFALSEEEALSKTVLDRAFSSVTPNSVSSIEYRGAALRKDSIEYQNLLKLKKGDIHMEPGYIWTSPNQGYVFNRYADATGGFKPQASIKYHILMPKGSKMLCVDRLNPETLLRYNSQFKVHNIQKSDNGNIQLFLEYLLI